MNSASSLFACARHILEAPRKNDICEMWLRIAGRIVCLKFAGRAIERPLTRAFRHLQIAAEKGASFTILAWDDVTTPGGTESDRDQITGRGVVYHASKQQLAIDTESRRTEAYDPELRLGLFHVPDLAKIEPWDLAAPFLRIFHWWALGEGLQLVHGAAIGTQRGGILLAGRGGSGKSTTSLSCIGSGLLYLADDYCLLEECSPPSVHSLYNSGKADQHSRQLLPRLANAFEERAGMNEGKSIAYLAEYAPAALLDSTILKAVVVTSIVPDGICEATPISPGEALGAVAPSTLFQLPGNRHQSLSRLAAIVRAIPCWRMTLGPNPEAAHAILRDMISNNS